MASGDTPKTVILKGEPQVSEAVMATSAAIKPGHLIELTSAGTVRKATLGFGATVSRGSGALFAVEPGWRGGDIDTAYANGDTVTYTTAKPGDEIYAFLQDAENVAIGQQLMSAGDGSLEAVDSDGFAIAIALEAVNTTGGASAEARIKVRII